MAQHDVNKKDHCRYKTIQEAVDQASPGDTIRIGRGTYYEKLEIKKDGLILIGEGQGATILSWNDYAQKAHAGGGSYGTFRTYTCLIQADNVRLEQLTIENTAGDGRDVGQAVALYADGDCLTVVGCQLIGFQDTLFTAPLPSAPRIPGSFIGPSENKPYRPQRQCFHQCTITGDVDYIFGSALVVFDQCQMISRDRGLKVNGYVTAPSTWQGMPYGYVFIESSFIGQEGIDPQSVYLGRPWRPYGQVRLINCTMDQSIHEDLWDPWGDPKNFETADFQVTQSDTIDFLDEWHQQQLKTLCSR